MRPSISSRFQLLLQILVSAIPELTVYIALFPGRIAEKQTVQCAGTGDKCVGAEDRDKRAGGKSHMKFQTALVISDLDTDKSAVFPFFRLSYS